MKLPHPNLHFAFFPGKAILEPIPIFQVSIPYSSNESLYFLLFEAAFPFNLSGLARPHLLELDGSRPRYLSGPRNPRRRDTDSGAILQTRLTADLTLTNWQLDGASGEE